MTPAEVAFLQLISTHTGDTLGKLKLRQLIIFRFSASRDGGNVSLFVFWKKSQKKKSISVM